MREIRRSDYDSFYDFAKAVDHYDTPTGVLIRNLHCNNRTRDWETDMVVRFQIGKIEVTFEKDLPKLSAK